MIIDDGVFRVESELDGWNERLMVFCDDRRRQRRRSCTPRPRLQRVLWDGRELSEGEWQSSGLQHAAAANRGGTRLAHPIDLTQACEYVSEPTVHPDGASIYMDTTGARQSRRRDVPRDHPRGAARRGHRPRATGRAGGLSRATAPARRSPGCAGAGRDVVGNLSICAGESLPANGGITPGRSSRD